MTYQPIRDAVAALSAQCDGAQTLDGVGFNGTDTHLGHAAAAAPLEAWTPGLARQVWEMLHKYSGQLADLGFDYATLPVPDADPSRWYAYVEVDGSRLAYRFPYDPSTSDTLKRTVPGLRWDPGAKTWWSKPSTEALTAAEAAGFTVTDAARALAAQPRETGPAGRVILDGESLVIAFDYDPRLVAAVKSLPSRRFDPATKRWIAPASRRDAVLAFATEHGFEVDPAILALDAEVLAEAARPKVSANGVFTITFDYDRLLVEAVREVPGARWDPYRRCWTAPREAAVEVMLWATRANAIVDESCGPLFAEAEATQVLIAASMAKDADLHVEGLLKPLMPFQRAGVAYALDRLGF